MAGFLPYETLDKMWQYKTFPDKYIDKFWECFGPKTSYFR